MESKDDPNLKRKTDDVADTLPSKRTPSTNSLSTRNKSHHHQEWDKNYFRGYADLNVHAEMLGDYSRTAAYREAILNNRHLFRGKTVADIGCGTGILTAFCVQAGAKHVYAVEASNILEEAKKVISANGMDKRVTFIHGRVEEIQLPEHVDIIVSEWMGHMLLFESMLQSVLFARDNWLNKNGYLFPDKAELRVALLSESLTKSERVLFWDGIKDMYGVDMSCLKRSSLKQLYSNVVIDTVEPQFIHSDSVTVVSINLNTISKVELLTMTSSFRLTSYGYAMVTGFCMWFKVHFPGSFILSTSPYEKPTHWQQTLFHVEEFKVRQDSKVEGQVIIKQNADFHRFLEINIDFTIDSEKNKSYSYTMDAFSY